MPNDYFRFRQFIVHQDRSAMKVCTDACLFGAWMSSHVSGARSILDIGTGTGLLSLMLAQHSTAQIDAIEIDGEAASQARDNFSASPWADRLQVFHLPVQQYRSDLLYDCIIANPPFYDNDLRGPDPRRNLAHHGTSITLAEWLGAAQSRLEANGSFGVLIPFHRYAELEETAANSGLFPCASALIRQTPKHDFFRAMYLFRRSPCERTRCEITIKDHLGHYTPEFNSLMKGYYLEHNNILQ